MMMEIDAHVKQWAGIELLGAEGEKLICIHECLLRVKQLYNKILFNALTPNNF